MKKVCLQFGFFVSLFFLFSHPAHAQLPVVKKPGITLGGDFIYSMPKESFKDRYNTGFGAEAYGGVGYGSAFLIGTIGVVSYKAHTGNSAGTLTAVPMKIGLKKYFLLKRLFINADVGTSSIKVTDANYSAFTAGFGVGVRLLGLEAALYYNAFKNTNASGYSNATNIKVGWSFSL